MWFFRSFLVVTGILAVVPSQLALAEGPGRSGFVPARKPLTSIERQERAQKKLINEIQVEMKGRPPFVRRTETGFRIGPDRRLNLSEIWQPLWQSGDHLAFLSLRSMVDHLDNFEGNLGLGYRRFTDRAVYGGYAYADRRVTALGSTFYQATLGGEYIRETWEARANVYLPINPTRRYVDAGNMGVVVAGTSVGIREAGTMIEEAQTGADAEAGFVLPDIGDFIGQMRVYGGAYYFDGKETPDILGVRTRIEADVNGWMKLGARAQYDAERGGQYMIEATFRWPQVKTTKAVGLWARMADAPERDVDVVTGGRQVEGPVDPLLDITTGEPVRILHVDNRGVAGGDGSAESPFSTLADGVGAIQNGDILYVRSGDGTSSGYNQGYTLNTDSVTLAGSGTPLTFDGARYATASRSWEGHLLVRGAEGAYPLISNASGDAVTITAPDVTLRGIQIDGANGNGLVIGAGADNVHLDDVMITGHTQNGIYIGNIAAPGIDVQVRNSVISGNLLSGIRLETTGGAVNLDLGRVEDYGFNDIFGNIGDALTVQNGGVALPARGNYWGGSALTDLGGVNSGSVDSSVYVTGSFCENCAVAGLSFSNQTDVTEGARVRTESRTATGFTGHRYIRVYGDGTPEWVIDGANTGTGFARIASGDALAVELTPSTTGYNTHFVTTKGAGLEQTVQAQTRFLPNMYNTLIGWWDARDLDGDFITTDQPGHGTPISSWLDKTGNGHTGTAVGSARPAYDATEYYLSVDDGDDGMQVSNSFLLSALNNGASVAMVLQGAPTGPDTTLFSYGNCTGGAGSRCFALVQEGVSGNASLRLDTNTAQNQGTGPMAILDGTPHLVWVSASGGGAVTLRADGATLLTGAYNTGTGFWNTNGLDLLGPINGGYGEILLFNGVPSNDARGLVEQYLIDKWGL